MIDIQKLRDKALIAKEKIRRKKNKESRINLKIAYKIGIINVKIAAKNGENCAWVYTEKKTHAKAIALYFRNKGFDTDCIEYNTSEFWPWGVHFYYFYFFCVRW